jgi:3-keto-5-aminohexanoate cleavage enzyme
VHVHLRDADGNPTADLQVAKRVVGLIEESCPALIQLSTGVGLGVEYEERERLELYDTGHLEVALSLLSEGLLEEPLAFSLVLGVKGGMAATPANIVHLVAQLPPGSVWQVIGIGRANQSVTAIGLAMGGNARTGMEDTLMLRRGVPASGNGELVRRLAGISNALERPPATVEEAAAALQLTTGVT